MVPGNTRRPRGGASLPCGKGCPANGNPASAGGAAACRDNGEGRGRPVPALPPRRKRTGRRGMCIRLRPASADPAAQGAPRQACR